MNAIATGALSVLLPSSATPAVGLSPGGPELLIGAALCLPVVMGITDLFGDGGDDDDQSEQSDDVDDDGLFGGTDDLDDSFDDIDGFGDGDDAGSETDRSVDELEGRFDELENEVAGVSSSISTVRSENEEISETVQEVEGHVRDLLDIYEMVTRGVNPFVDEASGGQFSGGGGSSIGLFTDDGNGGNGGNDVDEDVAAAEAESFFEDELDEPGDDELASPEDTVANAGGDALEVAPEPAATADSGGSKSFEELKAEYENGDSDWDDAGSDPVPADAGDEPDPPDEPATPAEPAPTGPATVEAEPAPADPPDETASSDPAEPVDPDPDEPGRLEFVGDRESGIDVVDGSPPGSTSKVRPHLETFPAEYVADLTAIEWMEDLVEVGGHEGATAALEYYVDIGWIGEDVREELEARLEGLGNPSGTPERSDQPLAAFGSAEHRRSLGYVSQLAGDTDRAVAIEQIDESAGGGSRGA